VRFVTYQPDGKILVAGDFTNFNGQNKSYLVRLNTDGTLDNDFNPGGNGASDYILAVKVIEEGKILIAGGFTSYNGQPCNHIGRLKPDGTLDKTFLSDIGADGIIKSILTFRGGKIVIGGDFTSYSRVPRNRIARLHADGTLDESFKVGKGADGVINGLASQSDGRILACGLFSTIDTMSRNKIVRLNSDGTVDKNFNPKKGADLPVYSMVLQNDGRILIAGDFQNFNEWRQIRITRLNSDGSIDDSFLKGTGTDWIINTMVQQPDGKIIFGGDFNSYDQIKRSKIARINRDGTIDNSFNKVIGLDKAVFAIGAQSDGKIIVAGDFTKYNGKTVNRLLRLNTDGSVDSSFKIGVGPNAVIQALFVQKDNKIIIAGNFTKFNNESRNKIACLNADGSLDKGFVPTSGANFEVYCIAQQNDGHILVGGIFSAINGENRNKIARLNADGSLDKTFNPGSGPNAAVRSMAIQPDGKILVVGDFTVFNTIPRERIVRLTTDGLVDNSFDTESGASDFIRAVALDADGKIYIAGYFETYKSTNRGRIARLYNDGVLDQNFNPGAGFDEPVRALVLSEGKIYAAGDFTAYNGVKRRGMVRLNRNGNSDAGYNIGNGFVGNVRSLFLQADKKLLVAGEFNYYQGQTAPYFCRIIPSSPVKAAPKK